jgi:hypothetical protein
MALTGANTVAQFSNQRQQAGAVIAQGAYTQRIDNFNAHLADLQAQDAISRGAQAEIISRQRTGQLIGAQRAAAGAQGVEVNSGSSVDAQADAARTGELDALTIRNNAARSAWGYQVQSFADTNAGQLAMRGATNTAGGIRSSSWGTLLTGASEELGQYTAMRTRAAGAKPVSKGK